MNELSQPTSSVTPGTLTTGGERPTARPSAWRRSWPALLALVAALPAAASDPVPPALKRKIVDAYGGAAALARVAAVRQTGQVTAVAQGGKTGKLLRLLALPDSLRVEIAYPGEPVEVRVHHGGKGARDGQDVTGTVPHFAMILQAARIALPLWIAAGDHDVRYTGPRERESRTLETLAVPLAAGLELDAEVDPVSGRIVRTIGRIPVSGGQVMEFVNTYSDFRIVSGIAFAHREENFARGVHTGDTVLDRIDVLTAAPAGAFDAPRAPAPAGSRL